MLISNQTHLLETQAYINACSITDAGLEPTGTTRKDIFDFSGGIYDLGIWNNVVFWMMREGQMAVSDTVYSLGGLGRFHGTAVNSPTQSADGLLTSAVAGSHMMSSYDFRPENGGSVFSIARMFDLYPGYIRYLFNRSNTVGATRIAEANNTYWQAYFLGAETSPTVPNISITYQGASVILAAYGANGNIKCKGRGANNPNGWENTTTYTTGQTFTHNGNCLFGQNGMYLPFTSLFNIEISNNQFESLYSLYKNTIGKGLGLP